MSSGMVCSAASSEIIIKGVPCQMRTTITVASAVCSLKKLRLFSIRCIERSNWLIKPNCAFTTQLHMEAAKAWGTTQGMMAMARNTPRPGMGLSSASETMVPHTTTPITPKKT